jgi:hypothetical protein
MANNLICQPNSTKPHQDKSKRITLTKRVLMGNECGFGFVILVALVD